MNDLSQVPGLAGYIAAQQQGQQQTMGNLNVANLLEQLQQRQAANQKEQAYRQELSGLGSSPTQEQLAGVAAKYGGPDALLKIQQGSLDRQAALAQQKTIADERLGQQKQMADMMHEYRLAQAKTADERTAEIARHNAVVEQFQSQNATTVNELKRLGLQIQQDKVTSSRTDKEEKDIEGQINKTANRLKDVQPVMVAAHQLNDLLSQYTPDNVPGVGYMKNTDMGKALLSKEGKDVSSSIKLVGNSILKAMSGTAVTAPEEVRQMAAQMADGRYDAKDFYVAWPKISAWLNSQSAVATSGLTDAARQRLIDRTGMNLDPVKPRYAVEYQGGKLNLKDTYAAPPPPPGYVVNK